MGIETSMSTDLVTSSSGYSSPAQLSTYGDHAKEICSRATSRMSDIPRRPDASEAASAALKASQPGGFTAAKSKRASSSDKVRTCDLMVNSHAL